MDIDQNSGLVPLAKFLIVRTHYYVSDRFEVATEIHHTNNFEDSVGEVNLLEETLADNRKDTTHDACKARMKRMSMDINIFMQQHQELFPKERPSSALKAYLRDVYV